MFVKPTSKIPFKKRVQDGGFDFYADLHDSTFTNIYGLRDRIDLLPGQVMRISTGCHCEFPDDTVWQWDVRSSAGLKGLDVTCRTIDNEYRGLLSFVVVNNTDQPVEIRHHDRIAQLVPNPFSSRYFIEQVQSISDLNNTDRGSLGFGSSGT